MYNMYKKCSNSIKYLKKQENTIFDNGTSRSKIYLNKQLNFMFTVLFF